MPRRARWCSTSSHLGTVRVRGRRARSTRCSGCSPTTSTRSSPGGRSTRTCSTPTTPTSSTTSSCGGSTTERFFVMPNASNTERLRRRARRGADVTARVESPTSPPTRAVLAVQGPRRVRCSPPVRAEAAAVAALRGASASATVRSVAGTGYTGEDGVELHVPVARRRRRCGTRCSTAGITPAGLGARDTLRLEAGLPLHGHELGPGHHAAAGRARLGRALDQGRLPGPGRARGRAASGASPAACAASSSRGASPRARAIRCWSTASRPARSPAATSRRCSGTASPSAFLPPVGRARRRGRDRHPQPAGCRPGS